MRTFTPEEAIPEDLRDDRRLMRSIEGQSQQPDFNERRQASIQLPRDWMVLSWKLYLSSGVLEVRIELRIKIYARALGAANGFYACINIDIHSIRVSSQQTNSTTLERP